MQPDYNLNCVDETIYAGTNNLIPNKNLILARSQTLSFTLRQKSGGSANVGRKIT